MSLNVDFMLINSFHRGVRIERILFRHRSVFILKRTYHLNLSLICLLIFMTCIITYAFSRVWRLLLSPSVSATYPLSKSYVTSLTSQFSLLWWKISTRSLFQRQCRKLRCQILKKKEDGTKVSWHLDVVWRRYTIFVIIEEHFSAGNVDSCNIYIYGAQWRTIIMTIIKLLLWFKWY